MRSSIFITVTAVLISSIIFLNCDSSDENQNQITMDENSDTDHLELLPDITVGIEIGDTNYVFGQIVEAVLNENGDILVLDASAMTVRKYSSDGTFIGSAGRQGTGPGEFQRPRGMAVLGNNDFIVTDMAGGSICIFNDSLNWTENITGFFPRPPFTVRTAGDSAFVGMLTVFNREEGLTGYSIARLENSPEPATIYEEEMMPFNPSRIGPLGEENNPVFTSDNSGRVFVSDPGTDIIRVTGYLPDGEVFMTIEENIDRVEKTEQELAQEQIEFEEFSTRMGSRGGRMSGMDLSFDPIPYRKAVSDLGIDAEGRLWVRLGGYRYPFWKIYGTDGEFLFTASVESDDPDIDDMAVRITENGATAWIPDPLEWPSVMVIEIPDSF